MPERPKRRKNNKNKRKNKNQRIDGNKNGSDVKQTEDAGSCSGEQTSLTEDINSIAQTSENLSENNTISLPSVSDQNSDAIIEDRVICFATENTSQDLNNNTDIVEPLEVTSSYSLNDQINLQESETYVVESPEQSLKPKSKRKKSKLESVKSKSLDNDDAPQIVEITDTNADPAESDSNVSVIDSSNVVVCEADTDVEWENANELDPENTGDAKEVATGTLSITTIPLNVAQCEQTKSLTPEEEMSLRHYLQTLNLATSPNVNSVEIKTEIEQIINREIKHRLRKKGLADDLFVQRLGPPRMLDVIDEEGSSESSMTSRRQSYLSDKRSDNDDLEDDVFEDKSKSIEKKYDTKSIGYLNNKSYGRLVPQQCMLVGTKLKEPGVTEARGDWTMQTVEKMTGAEIVYLTDSSSSTSSIHDIGDETDDSVETDVSVRMITPTIEVTDTEDLLKRTFVANNNKQSQSSNIEETSQFEDIKNVKDEYNNCDTIDQDRKYYENPHEIVILSTDDIKTNLYVKDLDDSEIKINNDKDDEICNNKSFESSKKEINNDNNTNTYNLEMKVIKCELNDAINNLIKEVSDTEVPNENNKDNFTRQDSSSSVCSSQCTAKYNPTSSSLNDVSNILHDETFQNTDNSTKHLQYNNTTTHVKDVFECVTGTTAIDRQHSVINQPLALRDLCVKKITNLPYGVKILEELASVSERLQNINVYGLTTKENDKVTNKANLNAESMPYYPLPDLSSIEKVSLSSKSQEPLAPPVQPRNSSLKKSQEDNHWTALPSKSDPVYVCLSPSQKMLMEKTNTVITKEDATELIDIHKKYVDRRGYNEYYREKKVGHEYDKEPPVVPFKSQTGSRLLALIRDPTVTYNINSTINDHYSRNQNYGHLDNSYNKSYNLNNRRDLSSTFKPIPPPRPKKYSSSFYESDESSDFTDSSFRSMKSERKYFHYSTGNLSKEIENDVSSIQNMHRRFTDIRDSFDETKFPRRPSLPKDICDKQMEYIRQKEKEVEAEIRCLEEEKSSMPVAPIRGPRAPLIKDNMAEQQNLDFDLRINSKNTSANDQPPEKPARNRLKSLFSSSEEELLRDKMYSEYVNQMAERQERKQHRIIKITNTGGDSKAKTVSKSMSALDILDSKVNNRIEKEFISRARERWDKLGIKDPETEDERESSKDVYREPKVIEHKIKVIEGNKETDVKKLPSHLQDFVRFTAKDKDDGRSSSAVWRPGAPTPPPAPAPAPVARSPGAPPPPPPPVWTPGSAGPSPQPSRKTFRPVHFEETPPARRKFGDSEQNGCTSGSESEGRLRTSQSAPATGLNSLGGSGRLPRAQNPTVTLLQKAREGQIPRGSSYLQQERDSARLPRDRPSPPLGDPVHALRQGYVSEGEGGARRMAAPRQLDGIGPTTHDGMPVALRSEVKDPSRWYKKMYDTIHKNKYDDDYVTIRYKSRRGEPPQRVSNKSQYAYFDPRSGYLSEPEGARGRGAWSDAGDDGDVTSGARRRTASVQEERRASDASSPYMPSNKYSTLASARASQEVYKNQPGRIEDYVPGRSSVIDKEAKQWWDEVMDIFDGWLDDNSPLPPYTTLLARAIQKSQNISSTTSLPQASPKEKKDITSAILSKSNMARALKESGYESDSTLVFRRRDEGEAPLSPAARRAAYRDLQAGGEPPLRGFRSPAPPRQDESEIEYIPISPTLTKIRVHKKTPKSHEVICYPVTPIETDSFMRFRKQQPSFVNVEHQSEVEDYPPAPPRRISSKNSRTLQLVTSSKPSFTTPKKFQTPSQSNVDFLKNRISCKLTRQNTQILSKREPVPSVKESLKSRVMSISAPPAVNRKSIGTPTSGILKKSSGNKSTLTSSFGSPRRTLLPTEYTNPAHTRYEASQSSVAIEGGAGRRTPITNILDKVTSLDKLWSSEKRNERIEAVKSKVKPIRNSQTSVVKRSPPSSNMKPSTPSVTHKSRDMVRTAEKIQKLKMSNLTKSNPCLTSKSNVKSSKPNTIQSSTNMSKSTLNITSGPKRQNQIKTAVVTNLKKKKSLESVVARPRSMPCHEACNKKGKEAKLDPTKVTKGKTIKKTTIISPREFELESQFGDMSCETSNFGSFENLNKKRISSKEIKETHDAVVSDSFFQHLFLGGSSFHNLSHPLIKEPSTTVLEKAQMFQSLPQNNKEPKSLNTYLIHRKPVSLSRFKIWDRYPSPLRVSSPRSISWPGRMQGDIRTFDSLSRCDEFGSSSSLATVRSKSEPPINKLYFSETSRPISPTVLFFKKEKSKKSPVRETISPSRLIFTQTTRPVSPVILHKTQKIQSPKILIKSPSPSRMIFTETSRPISPTVTKRVITKENIMESNMDKAGEKSPSTMYFSQTSRPVSPKVLKKGSMKSQSRSHSTSPVSIRSPSYRRIHNVRQQNVKQSDLTKHVYRTRSAGDADKKVFVENMTAKTKSDSNLNDDPDYDEYLQDIENTKLRSERFRELNRYYTYLERVGELEKATSTSDLRHRRRDEEIIDFDRWKKIRAIERAEEELNHLYYKLKKAQNEKDVLFYPRDVKDFRWNFDRDRGLRTKEKSVEDLKEHFKHISYYDYDVDPNLPKDTYKPLWRGTSVAETAFNINRKNDTDRRDTQIYLKPTISLQQDSTLSELRKKIGLGNRLWSSLSMEQVNALKNQLNSIYSKELEAKANRELEKFSIDVKDTKTTDNPFLHVRCNSLITPPPLPEINLEPKLIKSESIAAISCPITSVKELKNNVNKIQMSLSENEKRKISQTLSKEILDRKSKFDSTAPITLKDEIENSTRKLRETVIDNHKENPESVLSNITQVIDNNKESRDIVSNDNKRHIIYTNEKLERQYQSSASETDTASSDVSNKTVIYKGPSKEVQKKVEYFESVNNVSEQIKTIYQPRESPDEKEKDDIKAVSPPSPVCRKAEDTHAQKNIIAQSQSCANFKELFGETEKNKFHSLPSKPEIYSRSSSPHSEVHVSDRRTPDTLRYSSDETIFRSRSPSPDPERYWRAYLKLARVGEVRRLARRFDSPTAAGAVLRRHRSDPEIARNVFSSNWSSIEKSRREKMFPVARIPLRQNNRFMPHIDIISKLASLRRRTTPRSRSTEDTPECRAGEVDRIRRRFETMSLLGQIYASAPDMSELRDIAPYLAGSWIAHRYPKVSDNNRSVKDPTVLVRGRTSPVKKENKPKPSVKLSSILKTDVFSKQEFDPSLHRPASRYEPPRAPARPPPAAWPYRLAPYVSPSRHTVTFQESDSAPEPPRRAPQGTYSDKESPRRYVESDVNIHYRCPVRHDPLPLVPERELARQQAEHMKRLYREQRRNKYLQELQDMQNRRHQDNFTPSQKNILPLNRYDEADRIVARALYAFNGQTARELSFRKGDLINVRRQIDANWYEGEVHGRIGLFPYNYVEIMKGELVPSPKKPQVIEGRARAKFDFTAQTNLELPLKKGEVVVLTRRIDHNWWEGRNGNKTGIFPDSYVTVLQEPSPNKPEPQPILSSDKPVASPAAHGLLNGSAKRSMGAHSYMPQQNNPALSNAPPATQPLPGYVAKPAQVTATPAERGYGPPARAADLNNTEPLYVDTNAEAVPYRAMYKYRPQNPDELELNEGDTVYVLEKCDDGWYVGSSQRTGRFGTFPGNYVERI